MMEGFSSHASEVENKISDVRPDFDPDSKIEIQDPRKHPGVYEDGIPSYDPDAKVEGEGSILPEGNTAKKSYDPDDGVTKKGFSGSKQESNLGGGGKSADVRQDKSQEVSPKQDIQSDEGKSSRDVEKTEKKGGSYGELTKEGHGWNHEPPEEVHHMPSDDSSPLERNDGPAIAMDREDHRQTASCGNSREAQEYRAKQAQLISEGKFEEAMQMDIDDIHEKFGSKYDEAIEEMKDYAKEQGYI